MYRRRPWLGMRQLEIDREDLHFVLDILQLLLAQRAERAARLAANELAHGFGDAYAARLRQRLDSSGHIDAQAIDLTVACDRVSDGDADTIGNGILGA